MAKLDKRELAQAIQAELYNSNGYEGQDLAEVRKKALDYYYGRPMGTEEVGCSNVVSTDVADMVEAVVAAMLPAFETDNVIHFPPTSLEDEDQAQLESDAVNYFVMCENPGYVILQECIRDALLLRNAFTRVQVLESVNVEVEKYIGMNEMELFMLAQPLEDNEEIQVVDLEDNEDDSTLKDVKIKRITTTRRLVVRSVDPVNFYWSQNHDTVFLDDIPFCAERIFYTRSALIEMGYSKTEVMGLPYISVDTNMDSLARNRGTGNSQFMNASQPEQQVIECYEGFYRVDMDGDGVCELIKFLMAGDTVLSWEPADFVEFATGTPFIQPHRVDGLGLYDKLKTVQDIKTATLRQYLDNFVNANHCRMAYVKGAVNTEDLTSPQPGGAIGVDDINAIRELPGMDIGPSAQALLGYMDTVRSARGGASLDLQSAEAQIMGETAQGIERQYSVREMLAALMCRTLAETLVASTYKNVHRALRLYRAGRLTFPRGTSYGETDPSYWPERNKVNVQGGLSYGEKTKKIAALGNVIQQQQVLLTSGQSGVLVNLDGYYRAIIDWGKSAGIDNPEKYFIDPSSQESQQVQQQQQQQAMMQQQMMMQMQQQQQMMMQMQAQFEKYRHDSELQFKYWKERMDKEAELEKIGIQAQADIQVARVEDALAEVDSDNDGKDSDGKKT